MPKLRKFLCGCFGSVALVFLVASIGTTVSLVRHIHEQGLLPVHIHRTEFLWRLFAVFLAVLSRLILMTPPALAFLYGMAWWSVKQGKAAARGWAIAASVAMLLTSIPFFIAIYFVLIYAHRHSLGLSIFAIGALALGISGLVAFGPRDAAAQIAVEAAKPARIAGDGTSQLLDGLVWLLQMAGYIGGWIWWERWGRAQHMPATNGGLLWIAMAALLVTTTVHELGHAATGRMLGMRLRAFIVGPFQWRIRDGRWKFQFLLAKFFSAGGATAVVPTNPQQSRWNEICMIAAGPMAGLFIGTIASYAALTAKGQPYERYWEILALIATFGLVSTAVNLIPFRPEAFYSDGARIYQLLHGGPLADLHRVFNVAGASLVTPLRPRDYDIEAIQRAAHSFTRGNEAIVLRLLASSYFLDCGKIPQAREAVVDAERVCRESGSDLPAELCMAFVFRTALLRRDAAGARQWWERMEAKKPTHHGTDYWLAKSALLWIENRLEEAREAWNKGNALAQKLPAAGDYEFDRYRSALLSKALEEAPSARTQ